MDKFGDSFIYKEKLYSKLEDKNDDFLDKLIREKIDSMKIDNQDYEGSRLFIDNFYNYCQMPEDYRKWYDKEILNKYNKNEFFSLALKELTYQTYNKNNKEKKTIIKSLKLTNFVEDIFYSSREKAYTIKTKKGKYNLSPIARSYDEALDNLGHCHLLTEKLALKEPGVDVCCAYYKDSLFHDRYHSFAIDKKTNEVIDVAHNIKTDVDLYLNELNFNIIIQEESDNYFKNFQIIKSKDEKFEKSNICNLLKYAISKQMKITKTLEKGKLLNKRKMPF